jgi:hypothetical protein
MGWDVCGLSLPDDALRFFAVKDFELLVLDWNLPYKKGDEFLMEADNLLENKFKKLGKNTIAPFVICSSMNEEEIKIPLLRHFRKLGIWHKSIPFSSLLNQLDLTTSQIKKLGQHDTENSTN